MNYFWHFSPRKIIQKCKKIRLNETWDSEMLKPVMKGDKDLTTHLQLNHHPMLWFYQKKKKKQKNGWEEIKWKWEMETWLLYQLLRSWMGTKAAEENLSKEDDLQ